MALSWIIQCIQCSEAAAWDCIQNALMLIALNVKCYKLNSSSYTQVSVNATLMKQASTKVVHHLDLESRFSKWWIFVESFSEICQLIIEILPHEIHTTVHALHVSHEQHWPSITLPPNNLPLKMATNSLRQSELPLYCGDMVRMWNSSSSFGDIILNILNFPQLEPVCFAMRRLIC